MTLDPWIGDVVGKMHMYGISNNELAAHLGVTREYISMILNGRREPMNAKERLVAGVNELIAAKTSEQAV